MTQETAAGEQGTRSNTRAILLIAAIIAMGILIMTLGMLLVTYTTMQAIDTRVITLETMHNITYAG